MIIGDVCIYIHELFNFLWIYLDYIHIVFNILVTSYFLQGFTGFIQGFEQYLYEFTHTGVVVLWNYTQYYTHLYTF